MTHDRHGSDCCKHHFLCCPPNISTAKMDNATSTSNNHRANAFNICSKTDTIGNKIQTADIAGSIIKIQIETHPNKINELCII